MSGEARRRRGVVCVVVVLACARTATAAPAPCAGASRPAVALAVTVDPEDLAYAALVERYVSAALQGRHVGVCAGPGAAPPAAVPAVVGKLAIAVRREPGGHVAALIQVADDLTQKRLERTMDVSIVPVDGQPLAVAASADELLRASWAELIMIDAPPTIAPPPPVTAAVNASVVRPPPTPPRFELGVEGGALWSASRSALTTDVVAGFAPVARLVLLAGVTSAFGFSREGAHGAVRADDIGVMGGFAVPVTRPLGRLGLRVEGAVALRHLSFAVTSVPGVDALPFTDWSLTSAARALGWWRVGPVRLVLGVGATRTLRAARALDGTEVVMSNEGWGAQASLGVHGAF